jgi:hypothetical protein
VTAVVAALALGSALSIAAGTAAAASLVLADADKRQAISYGSKSVHQERFDAEWRVTNEAGDRVTVLTPFHRLAIAARHAAFKNQALRPNEPDRLLREQKDRLVFLAEIRGPRPDFTRGLVPELVVGDRTLKAAFVQNEHTPARQEDGRYLAQCVWAFPTKELAERARVTLRVRDGDGREAGRFTIDLGAMR